MSISLKYQYRQQNGTCIKRVILNFNDRPQSCLSNSCNLI